MISCLSLDLQGTLSKVDFSDNFWLELLPQAYAKRHAIGLAEAKKRLRREFSEAGKYDIRYYDDSYWVARLGFDTLQLIEAGTLRPELDEALFNLIELLDIPKIIVSTTTNTFINYELGDKKQLFVSTYSCVDDFNVGGKTPEVFRMIAAAQGISPNNILHIGDNSEMDVLNAERAGVQALLYDGDVEALGIEIAKAMA